MGRAPQWCPAHWRIRGKSPAAPSCPPARQLFGSATTQPLVADALRTPRAFSLAQQGPSLYNAARLCQAPSDTSFASAPGVNRTASASASSSTAARRASASASTKFKPPSIAAARGKVDGVGVGPPLGVEVHRGAAAVLARQIFHGGAVFKVPAAHAVAVGGPVVEGVAGAGEGVGGQGKGRAVDGDWGSMVPWPPLAR